MVSSLCAICNKPVWHFYHSPNHPANKGIEDLTHDFTVPKESTFEPEPEKTFVYDWANLPIDATIVVVAFAVLFGISQAINAVVRAVTGA